MSPYGMGDIEIEVVRTETGRMQITMTAETASVLQILRHDKDQLLDALQSRGIAMETADLDFQTFDDRGRQNQQQPQSLMLTNLAPEQEADASPVPAVRVTGGSGLLDILT
jgi:flagellar hook-length control protein FliK